MSLFKWTAQILFKKRQLEKAHAEASEWGWESRLESKYLFIRRRFDFSYEGVEHGVNGGTLRYNFVCLEYKFA